MAKHYNDDDIERARIFAEVMFQFKKICNEKEAYFAKKFELTPVEFRCVKYLLNVDFLIVKELAELMNLKASRITRIITSLEEKHFIIRELDLEDRRNVKVKLNKKKKDHIMQMDKAYTELHEEIIAPMNKKDAQKAIAYLEEMYGVFEDWVIENVRSKKNNN